MGFTPVYIQIAEKIKTRWLMSSDAPQGMKLPTQEELAVHFEVSRATIIRALSKLVAEGYLHSQQGSGFYATETLPNDSNVRYISLIVPELRAYVIVHTCRGVERRARQLGYQVLLASSEGSLEHEQELVEQHIRAGAKGIILYPVTRRKDQLPNDYLVHWKHNVQVVALDLGCEEWPCTRVHFDNYRLGYDMTQLLLRHGRQKIEFMHAHPDYLHSSIHERKKGWEAAMEENGLPIPDSYRNWPVPTRTFGPLTDEDYDVIAKDFGRLDPRPDALIAWNDEVAAHMTQALLNQGVRIPEDLCIAGFDNEPMITRLFRPLFPTSRPDFTRLGELGVEALDGIIRGGRKTPRIYYHSVSVLWREPRTVSAQHANIEEWEEAVLSAEVAPNGSTSNRV